MIYYLKINHFGEYVEHSNLTYLSGDMYAVKVFYGKLGYLSTKYYSVVYQPGNYDLSYSSLKSLDYLFVFLSRRRSLKTIFSEICDAIPPVSSLAQGNKSLLADRNTLIFEVQTFPKLLVYVENSEICLNGPLTLPLSYPKDLWDRGIFSRNYFQLP